MQFSGLFNATRAVPEGFPLMRRCLLLHRGGMLLGELAEEQGLLPQSVLGFRVAAAARPDLGSGRAALARVLAAQGQDEEALAQIQAALETDPFLAGAVKLQVELLLRTNRFDQARQVAAEHECIARALAPRPGLHAPLDPIAGLEQARESLARLLEQRTAAA
jgi:tetratricopeptide (TPR) repeat protein